MNNTKENSINHFKKGRLQRYQIILMLWCVFDFVSAERQEMRGRMSLWTLQDGSQRRCLPITGCGINRELRPCSIEGEEDRCVECQAGKINMDPTSSYTYFPCYSEPVCPEGTVKDPDPSPSSISCNPRCRCDPLQGWVGLDSCLCTKVDYECGHDTFLNKDGHCTACPEGSHKPGLGYGPCLNATKTGLSIKTTTAAPSTSSQVAPTTSAASSATNDSSSVKKEPSSVIKPDPGSNSDKTVLLNPDELKRYSETQFPVIIAVAVLGAVIALAIISGLVFICRRKIRNSAHHTNTWYIQIQRMDCLFIARRETVANSGDTAHSGTKDSQTQLLSVDARFPTLATDSESGTSSFLLPSDPDQTKPKVCDV